MKPFRFPNPDLRFSIGDWPFAAASALWRIPVLLLTAHCSLFAPACDRAGETEESPEVTYEIDRSEPGGMWVDVDAGDGKKLKVWVTELGIRHLSGESEGRIEAPTDSPAEPPESEEVDPLTHLREGFEYSPGVVTPEGPERQKQSEGAAPKVSPQAEEEGL
ncbi:MAG: hypothetical protein HYY13_07035 [Nitrospirae bacterium]|nr:hypothetical protein [Nitrospirota bacterium]